MLFILSKQGNTPLHTAVENDQESAVIALLSHGADPNLTNKRVGKQIIVQFIIFNNTHL